MHVTEGSATRVDVKRRMPRQSGELALAKLRFKAPDSDTSELRSFTVRDSGSRWAEASADFRFAAAVACYGMLLRRSEHAGGSNWGTVRELASDALGDDRWGDRRRFLELVQRIQQIRPND